MSYILDALRRAQAERERGQVPGLHAQPGLGATQRMRAGPASATRPAWLWALGGAMLVALVLALVLVPVLWMKRGGGAGAPAPGGVVNATPAAQPAPQAQPAPPAEVAPPLVVVSAAPVPKAPTAAVTAARPSSRATVAVLPASAAASTVAPLPALQPAPTPAADGAPAAAAAARPPAAAAAAAAPAPAALPPALTAEQRRDWPPLALGGSVWSDTPSARFVILGGQVVREGDSTSDGVLVERITPKVVILRWRDQRASLAF